MVISNASDEVWNGKSQFGPHSSRAIDTIRFNSTKVKAKFVSPYKINISCQSI